MFFENVAVAFASVITPYNLLLMAIGVLAGLTAGAIPGFTITMAVVLPLPFTFGMQPIEGLSTMIGVYVGALTGGLYACALIGIPGTPSAIPTTFDAFPMARSGRAAGGEANIVVGIQGEDPDRGEIPLRQAVPLALIEVE